MRKHMTVSILKETRDKDRRVVILPDQVNSFKEAGFDVFVEHDAGVGCGVSDEAYKLAGATMLPTEDAWSVSNFVVKYKFPSTEEYRFFRKEMHLCSYFYPGENYDLTHEMMRVGMTGYSYEYFQAEDGSFPLMASDSELSGKLAVIHGAYNLQNYNGGNGMCLPHITGTKRAKVVVIGHGNSGGAAARLASAMGAEVVVIGHRLSSLRKFQSSMPSDVKCYLNSPEVLAREVPGADLLIGAILISTYDTPTMVSEDLVKKMRPGSMIIDITCGYGPGYMPTAHSPTKGTVGPYLNHGVLHYKNDILPSLVHQTASEGTSVSLTPYLIKLGQTIFNPDISDSVSDAGRFVRDGKIEHHHVLSDFALIEAERDIA